MAVYSDTALNQKMVTGALLNNLKNVPDYVSYHRSDVVFDVNAANTNTAVVRIQPTLSLSNTPAANDRDNNIARTTATASNVEVTLTTDKYFNVAIDPLDVNPTRQFTEIGVAGSVAMGAHSNATLIAAAVADGTDNYLGETFGSGTTGTEVWDVLVDLTTAFQTAELTEDNTLYITPAVWGRLIKGVETLRVGINPKEQAAVLLGVKRVVVAPLTGALAIVAHASGLVGARRIVSIKQHETAIDTEIVGRIKCGAKVLDADAVQVLLDGAGS